MHLVCGTRPAIGRPPGRKRGAGTGGRQGAPGAAFSPIPANRRTTVPAHASLPAEHRVWRLAVTGTILKRWIWRQINAGKQARDNSIQAPSLDRGLIGPRTGSGRRRVAPAAWQTGSSAPAVPWGSCPAIGAGAPDDSRRATGLPGPCRPCKATRARRGRRRAGQFAAATGKLVVAIGGHRPYQEDRKQRGAWM